MGNSFLVPYTPGKNVYVTIANDAGSYWNFTAGGWQAFNPVGAAPFTMALSTTGRPPQEYAGTFPPIPTPGDYVVTAYDVAGANWATTDNPIGARRMAWDGADFVSGSINDARAGGPTGIRNMVYDNSFGSGMPRILSYDSVVYDTEANAILNDGVTGAIEVKSVIMRYDSNGLQTETITT